MFFLNWFTKIANLSAMFNFVLISEKYKISILSISYFILLSIEEFYTAIFLLFVYSIFIYMVLIPSKVRFK